MKFVIPLRHVKRKAVGIEQFETLAAVLDTYGRLILRRRLHHVVLGLETQRPILDGDTYRDETILIRGGAVLEGILDKRDQDHGRDLHVALIHPHVKLDPRVAVQTQRLQIDILPYVVDFAADGYRDRIGVGIHVPQYVRELHECRLGLLRFGYDKAVKGIERVEQKMGIDLRLV